MKRCENPVGPDNILKALERTSKVITAWGTKGGLMQRNKWVMKILDPYRPSCLEITKEGHPKHPLYVPGNCEPFRYLV